MSTISELLKYRGLFGGSGGVTSWNDLPDRPFGESDNVVVLPKTHFLESPAMPGTFAVQYVPLELIEGHTYTVNWNGVDYETVCFMGVSPVDGSPALIVGNPVAVGGENNNLPFAVGGNADGIMAAALDGSTSVFVSIKGYGSAPIPTQYAASVLPYYVPVYTAGMMGSDAPFSCESCSNLAEVFKSGRHIVCKIIYLVNSKPAYDYYYLTEYWEYDKTFEFSGSAYSNYKGIRLKPKEDDTFSVTLYSG